MPLVCRHIDGAGIPTFNAKVRQEKIAMTNQRTVDYLGTRSKLVQGVLIMWKARERYFSEKSGEFSHFVTFNIYPTLKVYAVHYDIKQKSLRLRPRRNATQLAEM